MRERGLVEIARAAAERGVGDGQVRTSLAAIDAIGPVAEFAKTEQARIKGATAVRHPSRMFGVIVGVVRHRSKPHGRCLLEPGHGVAAVVDEGRGQHRIHATERQ